MDCIIHRHVRGPTFRSEAPALHQPSVSYKCSMEMKAKYGMRATVSSTQNLHVPHVPSASSVRLPPACLATHAKRSAGAGSSSGGGGGTSLI